MAYHFYLGKTLCPVAPSKVDMKIRGQNKTLTLINEGEINIIKKAGLTEISFDLLLPNVKYPFAVYESDFQKAGYYLKQLEALKKSDDPFQFIITRTFPNGILMFDTNMKVSLEDYTVKEDSNEGFDVIVSIKLKQYRDFGTKVYKVAKSKKKAKVKKKRKSKSTSKNKSYTVKSGDCLWNIAKKFYGSGTDWKKIYNANKSIIEKTAKKYGRKSSSNGHWIYPGTKLVIPAK